MRFDASSPWLGYAAAVAGAVLCTLVGRLMVPRFDIVNVAMVYLVPVVLVALRFTRGAAIASALLCVLAFDYVFVPPEGTFTVDDVQYLLTFAIMVGLALLVSGLMERGRRHTAQEAALAVEAETERIRSTLLASISHDLRTPLAVMTGASSSLAQGGDRISAEERAALAQSIYEQAHAMSDQVAKVLQMTRIETGALKVEKDWVSIAEITGSVMRRIGSMAVAHRLLLDMPDDLPLIRADATLIDQALGNLIENAVRHTPSGTVVWVRAKSQGDHLLVTVEDFGPGIAEADVERVFAKFSRGDDASGTASRSSGVGLGLAICRAIVRLHGGRAWAERIVGGGTAFRFTLPVAAAPAAPAAEEG